MEGGQFFGVRPVVPTIDIRLTVGTEWAPEFSEDDFNDECLDRHLNRIATAVRHSLLFIVLPVFY